ncbi:MAG: hypothetical protein H7Z72_03115 [Bacteroidetes bacterium]|nr:hypothetical protein [Fibrella sp.]
MRSEDARQANSIFVFVLRGVVDVQHRLLHETDGLAWLNVPGGVVEFESLSNESILLLDVWLSR